MEQQDITNKAEEILKQVETITDKLNTRTLRIDFDSEILSESAVSDLKLHLGYTKVFSDLAKVRLQYTKTIRDEARGKTYAAKEDESDSE